MYTPNTGAHNFIKQMSLGKSQIIPSILIVSDSFQQMTYPVQRINRRQAENVEFEDNLVYIQSSRQIKWSLRTALSIYRTPGQAGLHMEALVH